MIVLYQIALAVTALGAFLISTAIWLRKAKDRTKFDTIFGFMAVSLIAWAVGRYGIFVAQDKDTANFWVYIIYNGSILVHVFFLHTILVFLEVEKKYRLILASFYALAAILLSLNNFDFVTSSQLFTKGVEAKLNFRFYEVPGPLHFLHLINYTFIPLFSFVLMLLHIKKFSGEKLQQLKFIIFSSILGLLGGNSVVPLVFGIPIEPLFLFLVPFHLLTLIYAITRHHLFNIKVIATEIFTFTLLILMLTRTFLADNLQDRLIDSGLFGATLILGIFLVRSVVQETKIREKVEKLAKQLQNVNEKLQQVDKVKTEFISIASHQLRTPLTIIKGYTSMALEGTFGRYTKQQHEVMDKLFQSANRLINLVEDLLNISRLEQGRIEYEYKVIDPVALVRGVVEELEQKAKNKGLRLIFIKPKHSVPHIRADEQKIRQVYINVIDNAVKYTEKGSVTVSLHREEDKVRFESVDTGIGITKDDLSTLFHKFVRGSHVTQMYTEGVGLGLYFARKVAENHGGKIWAESSGKDQGSKFIVELPMAS